MSRANRGRERRLDKGPQPMPFRALRNPYHPVQVLSADHVENLHLGSLTLLSKGGMRVLAPAARKLLASAGCAVDDTIVRFDPELIEAMIALAPSEFTLQARDPSKDLTASFEKLIIDAEMLQMMAEYLQPIVVDDDSLGLDAIEAVGPGGHFFGSPHTLQRYETAFYSPLVSDWRNYETWSQAGALDARERAHVIWRQLLERSESPALDTAIDEALTEFVARRKEALR